MECTHAHKGPWAEQVPMTLPQQLQGRSLPVDFPVIKVPVPWLAMGLSDYFPQASGHPFKATGSSAG
jgi:hypothetical protein